MQRKVKKGWIKKLILLGCLAAFILSLHFDRQIAAAIQASRNAALDGFFSCFLAIQGFIFYPLIVAATACLLFWKQKRFILPYIISTGIAALAVFLLKGAFARPRPLSSELDSFPSGHATQAFTPLAFLERKLFGWINTAWLVLACFLSLTRLWFGLHYLSDLIAGAAIGYGIALVLKRVWIKK